MDWITDPQTWIALVTLISLEIVLGIDNIIFISILAGSLPEEKQESARRIGLSAAMISRILLLLSISFLTKLTTPLFTILGHEITGRGMILIAGGLFLLGKSTFEIHEKLEGETGHGSTRVKKTMFNVILQIMILDLVFSLDSVITAVGMADQLGVMIAAVVAAVAVMMFAARPISDFVHERPTLKILALSFLLLIGVSLIAEGMEFTIPKGYIYFAMGFSFFVEVLNIRFLSRSQQPVQLHEPYLEDKKV